MSGFTITKEQIHDLCFKIVQEHIPYETELFEPIWDNFWRIADCDTIEEYSSRFLFQGGHKSVIDLGAVGFGDEFDTVQLIDPYVRIFAKLYQLDKEKLNFQDISNVIADIVKDTSVESHVKAIFREHMTPMISQLLKISVPEKKTAEFDDSHLLLIEWNDGPTKDCKEPQSKIERFDPAIAEEQFRRKRDSFTLYIDETVPLIKVKGCKDNLWDDLSPSQSALLGIILTSLRTRRAIEWSTIAEQALSYDGDNWGDWEEAAVRKCMYKLHKNLKGVLKDTIKAVRGFKAYGPNGYISYCWIRSGDGFTRLSGK